MSIAVNVLREIATLQCIVKQQWKAILSHGAWLPGGSIDDAVEVAYTALLPVRVVAANRYSCIEAVSPLGVCPEGAFGVKRGDGEGAGECGEGDETTTGVDQARVKRMKEVQGMEWVQQGRVWAKGREMDSMCRTGSLPRCSQGAHHMIPHRGTTVQKGCMSQCFGPRTRAEMGGMQR